MTITANTPATVTAHPRSQYVADLIGTNLVAGEVADGVLVTSSGAQVVVAGAAPGPGFAMIRPQAIALQRHVAIDSSVRNSWTGTIGAIDLLGDRVRVGVLGALPLTAEITAASLAELDLQPGDAIVASAKATDITAYPA